MTTPSPDQTPAVQTPAAEPIGYVVVDAVQIGDLSGWMTPRMRATPAQAEDDRVFWLESGRAADMDLRLAALVLLDD